MNDDIINKDKNDFADLVNILKILRSQNGCPWDREQNHKSIRNNFIEEVYEAVEGIDNNDNSILCEELGDVLLQVVFHANIAEDEHAFTINDVVDGICKKLISRHPHVFGTAIASDSKQVLEIWDKVKQNEKSQTTQEEAMNSISKALPSLTRAYKINKKAAKYSIDKKTADYLNIIKAQAENLDSSENLEITSDKTGDLLFAITSFAQSKGIDPEEALYFASERFLKKLVRKD